MRKDIPWRPGRGFNVAATIPIPELVALDSIDVRTRFGSLENMRLCTLVLTYAVSSG
jgi:hypothetical protein